MAVAQVGQEQAKTKRTSRQIPEREIAIALVLEFAESGLWSFSLMGFYDDDANFISDLAKRLNVAMDKSFHNKLARVVRQLVNHDVFCARMSGNQKEYIGEPEKQMDYRFSNPGKVRLLTIGETAHTNSPEWEASFLLRRAYPDPDRYK